MGSSFDDWKAEATPDRKQVRVCLDRALLADLEAAEQALEEIPAGPGMLSGDAEGEEVKARVEELRAAVRAKSRTMMFESIGRKRWRDLIAQHPPTDEQRKSMGELGQRLDHNPETFPATAIAASCVEPELTIEDARWLVDQLPLGVVDRIWAACLSANVTGSRDPFDIGSVVATPGARR